jgi:protoporphyrinogen oxidase
MNPYQIDAEARHLAAELGWQLQGQFANELTVAIVGGGPGGLFTAYLLQKKLPGAKVTIFEAGRRLGGKILTCAFSDGTPYEGGVAELYEYHSPEGKPDPFRQLIEDDLGLHTQNMEGGGVVLGDDVLPDFDAVAKVYGPETRQALERFHVRCAELMPLEKYASRWQADNSHPAAPITGHAFVKQQLGEFPHAEHYARTAVHSDLAAEGHQCNGLNLLKNVLLDNGNYMRLYWVVGGIEEIVRALTVRIGAEICFGTRVTCIGKHLNRYRVKYICGDNVGSRNFDVVIVAMPNHWLSRIQWE